MSQETRNSQHAVLEKKAEENTPAQVAKQTEKSSAGAPQKQKGRPRVVIVGAGFGGVHTAETLAHSDVDVLLVDRNTYSGFWPLLYQVSVAGLEPGAIGEPVRALTHKHHHMHFQQAEVRGVDFDRRQLQTDGPPIAYDYLVLAAGSANNYFGHDELAQHTFGLKDIYDAVRLRDHIVWACEQAVRETDRNKRRELLTFVIVGGGPTGVELAGALAEYLNQIIAKNYPTLDKSEAQVIIVQGGDSVLKAFPSHLRTKAQGHLKQKGVTLNLGHHVTGVKDGTVTLDDGSHIQAGTVVWAAGVRAAQFAEALDIKLAHKGRVPVQPTLNLSEHPEVFVIGDMAYLEGYKGKEAYPMVAPVAIQQGRQAAHNIAAHLAGKPLEPFHYLDKGTMSTVGRKFAVMDAFGLQLSGFLAWLCWLFVHQFYLLGFRTRLLVLLNWLYNAFTEHQSVQLVGLHETDSPQPNTPAHAAAGDKK